MADLTIYTTSACFACRAAKEMLDSEGVSYTEIDVSGEAIRSQMAELAGGQRRVPQVFVNETHIGGLLELSELHQNGRLRAFIEGS